MAHLKVVATDGLDSKAQEKLKNGGAELIVHSATAAPELIAALQEADIAIIRSATILKEAHLQQLPNLKGVLRAGVGIDNIDLKAAEKLGIWVWNAPTGNFQATAELAIGLIFAVSRRIAFATEAGRSAKWVKKEIGTSGRQLQGSTLGIFGAGNIGLRTAKMGAALGMKVQVCDPLFKAGPETSFESVSFESLIANSDFISIHSPLIESTHHKFNAAAFSKMKKGSMIVNAARGGIIHEGDLLVALESGHLGGAGLDVFEVEPFDSQNAITCALLAHERVVSTPHIGAQTAESQKAVGLETADKILAVQAATQGLGEAPRALNAPTNPRLPLKFS